MTTKEMIEVMQAYEDGKTLQTFTCGTWVDVECPAWNWYEYDYRIKPEKTFRPYKDADEMIKDWANRFGVGSWPSIAMPLIWVLFKEINAPYLVCGYLRSCVAIGVARPSFSELLDDYTYLDGSPCGKEIS